MASASPSEPAARRVVDLLRSRPATLGAGRLVCLDGPAGSGKTTLAAAVAALVPQARVVHMDDLYDGWTGLPRVGEQLETLLRPLAHGEPGRYRRHDWHRGTWAETVEVAPTPLLVLEGVGSGSLGTADLATVLVWVHAPRDQRLARGLARDGEAVRAEWTRWTVAEQEHFRRDGTRQRADLVVDTGDTGDTGGPGGAGGAADQEPT